MCCAGRDRAVRPRAAESATTFSLPAVGLDHELERSHTVVVIGARLDHHFLERRHLLVAGRPQNAHVGRAIVQHADEVLGVAVVRQAVDVVERDAIRAVLGHRQVRREHLVVPGEVDQLRHHQVATGRCATGLSVVDRELHLGAGRRVDVAAVLFGVRLEADAVRIVVTRRRSARSCTGRITSTLYSGERAEPAVTEVRERHGDVVQRDRELVGRRARRHARRSRVGAAADGEHRHQARRRCRECAPPR